MPDFLPRGFGLHYSISATALPTGLCLHNSLFYEVPLQAAGRADLVKGVNWHSFVKRKELFCKSRMKECDVKAFNKMVIMTAMVNKEVLPVIMTSTKSTKMIMLIRIIMMFLFLVLLLPPPIIIIMAQKMMIIQYFSISDENDDDNDYNHNDKTS